MSIAFGTVLFLVAIVAYVFSYHAADDGEHGIAGLLHGVTAVSIAAGVLEIVMPKSGFGYAVGTLFILYAVAAFVFSAGPYTRRPEGQPMRREEKLQFAGLLAVGALFAAGSALQFVYVV